MLNDGVSYLNVNKLKCEHKFRYFLRKLESQLDVIKTHTQVSTSSIPLETHYRGLSKPPRTPVSESWCTTKRKAEWSGISGEMSIPEATVIE